MALQSSFPALLDTLAQALSSATESIDSLPPPIPPADGISLLDVKNELFLSYLHNLVFLIVIKLRNSKNASFSSDEESQDLDNSVVKKLVELQVYLEKGVRPIEGRLKYQIDKVLRAADDAKRAEESMTKTNRRPLQHAQAKNFGPNNGSSDEDDDDSMNGAPLLNANEIDDLQFRPNPTSFIRPAAAAEDATGQEENDGIYKPPRIQATAMPTTTGPREKGERRPNKSATLDEFVTTELSAAPLAEPSIGSTITSGGRRSKSERERKDEAEKKEYEEKNYTRLPKESKKERAKKQKGRDAGYGGEEWRGLGEGIDRIERLTKRKSGEGRSILDKSRKRPTEDGPRGSGGVEIGQGFQKRLKTLDGGVRKRGRR
ncbi:Sas10/Utp3/C1D family-domain-containing protein [Amylocarpus encephaloides]|uniref:Sas10/Utp3/C1D family-domain-containing protein n=1 Tax=Amylocarpus encephaloides TaxID=45428 RepID=A0A9P8CA05_9HELO|nr:Sas10/Utp3/C1D family-domain-containing protein [Amylocarpus encephaloides]